MFGIPASTRKAARCLNLFRRRQSVCTLYGRRTGQKCPNRPPCPIDFEGIDPLGRSHSQQAVRDPRTDSDIGDWTRASEVSRGIESAYSLRSRERNVRGGGHLPFSEAEEPLRPGPRIAGMRNYWACFACSRRVAARVSVHSESALPGSRGLLLLLDRSSRIEESKIAHGDEFYPILSPREMTSHNPGADLFRTIGSAIPSSPESRSRRANWRCFGRRFRVMRKRTGACSGQQTARPDRAVCHLMRYTGMDLSTTMTLPKSSVRPQSDPHLSAKERVASLDRNPVLACRETVGRSPPVRRTISFGTGLLCRRPVSVVGLAA